MENTETFASLINSLKNSYENGAENTQLLQILEKMRNELASTTMVPDHTSAPVSVWLPSGYQPLTAATILTAQTEREHKVTKETENVPVLSVTSMQKQVFIKEEIDDSKSLNQASGNPIFDGAFSLSSVPKPPTRIMVEQDDSSDELIDTTLPEKQQVEEVMAEGILKDAFLPASFEMEEENGSPQVFELTLDVPEVMAKEELEQNKPMSIPPGFLVGEQPAATLTAKPRELHEILANRVVAKEETVRNQPKILADSLGASKIHDLKKGIGINDRFRFIKSLFRGDETLFERSVKTINNFNILPEAEYWIQRELVIKLGWNEEDELVQLFYHLVNRRFL